MKTAMVLVVITFCFAVAEFARLPNRSMSQADPCTVVIFGACGDLSRHKLTPALYGLAAQTSVARRFAIIGFARTAMNGEAFQQRALDSVTKCAEPSTPNGSQLTDFAKAAYVPGKAEGGRGSMEDETKAAKTMETVYEAI